MTKYKKVATDNNRTLFFVDGKMKSQTAIPSEILKQLETGVELEIDTPMGIVPKAEQIDRTKCLVDAEPATHEKFLHGITIGLCDEHYQLSTGKVAQAMREHLNRGNA